MADEIGPRPKRRRLSTDAPADASATFKQHDQESPKKGLDRPISPPVTRRKSPIAAGHSTVPAWNFDNVPQKTHTAPSHESGVGRRTPEVIDKPKEEGVKYMSSPFQLTHIRDMAAHQNVDALQLKDILGDPLIKECWNFNYLFDIDFVMKHFDSDVRDLVKVKIIHGFWKNDDKNRIAMLETAERYPNVELLHAYIPDPFGTHHSKMLVLFRHDDQAQVIIHTANMIARDWANMTQAVWCSPLLPLCKGNSISAPSSTPDSVRHPIGSGERFKMDLLHYFRAYGKRLSNMTEQLTKYDFSAIRAAFIGSAPSRQKPVAARPSEQTSFGWLGLQEILSSVSISTTSGHTTSHRPHIVMQVSSIATLGAAPTWLSHLQSVLARSALTHASSAEDESKSTKASSFFEKVPKTKPSSPTFNIIFPTPAEIRSCLDGYTAGGSIHIKLQSAQQQKQLEYLHPLFCHWTVPSLPSSSTSAERSGKALRGAAAPHVKTYIRFSDKDHKSIDWAMVTSANLSKQAWGDVVNKKDEIWIQSWEAGVVVWPALFKDVDEADDCIMVPVFAKDTPGPEDIYERETSAYEGENSGSEPQGKTVVGFRMPYDLPLTSYAAEDRPWCATMQYAEPDRFGFTWGGY